MKNNSFIATTQQSTQQGTKQPAFRTNVKAGQQLGLDPDKAPGLDPDVRGPGLDPDAPLS